MKPLGEAPEKIQASFRQCIRHVNHLLGLELDPETYSFTTRRNRYLFTSSVKGARRIVVTDQGEDRPKIAVHGLAIKLRKKS